MPPATIERGARARVPADDLHVLREDPRPDPGKVHTVGDITRGRDGWVGGRETDAVVGTNGIELRRLGEKKRHAEVSCGGLYNLIAKPFNVDVFLDFQFC